MTTHPRDRTVDVLIIGAGISGIGTASRLRREFPGRSFAILERRQGMGGTWDLFRYPGVRSDSDMFTFGLELRPWDDLKVLADGDSIRGYIEDTAAEYGISDDIHFGLKVVSADWSSAGQRWTVTALHESTGETQVWTASFVVTCTGYYDYDNGYLPEFPGIDSFEGTTIHPQHWPEDLDYTGKKVVVIGSGATAVTVVPAMTDKAAHVTMLQRSPSYVFALPALDKISGAMKKVLPDRLVFRMTRRRNIVIQRTLFKACRRWPALMRRFLLAGVRRGVGPDFDMVHFSPKYNPWDERLCAVPDGDLFDVLRAGKASVVTDTIETFTPTGIALSSGQELEADIVVTATGLKMQMLGGARISVDGVERNVHDQLTYKSVLLEGVPNLMWVFGYTNASWTLKVDLAGAYLVRLLRHMEATGRAVAVAVDRHDNANGDGIVDELASGYVQRGKDVMPRQGRAHPWHVLMDYQHDTQVLLHDPIDDGVLVFTETAQAKDAVA